MGRLVGSDCEHQNMVGKKAYMRTLEVILAMVLTFAFVLYIMPAPDNTASDASDGILIGLIESGSFRESAGNMTGCAYKSDNTTLTRILDGTLPEHVNYAICPKGSLPSLPRKKVKAESVYLTGNITAYDARIVRLYYWE